MVEEVDVVVLGAGPAGVAAGAELRRCGVRHVVVLDREDRAGGATRHCGHPTFGLREFGRVLTGSTYALRLAREAERLGLDLRLRHSVVSLGPQGHLTIATPDGRRELRGRRVILATGARESSRSARLLPGDRPLGVINTGALQAQVTLHNLKPFARPVIVGTELVGLSAIWTCLSHGIRPQMVVEAMPAPVVRWPLGLFPALARIPVRTGATITDIRGQPRLEAVEVTDARGRRETVACDGLLLTGRFVPEAALLRGGPVAIDPATGGPGVDQYGRCTDPAYVAAGNLLRPVESAGWCYREGRAAGRVVAADLAGKLPPFEATAVLRPGAGVRFIVPQRLNLPLGPGAVSHVQLRLAPGSGTALVVRRNGRPIWTKTVHPRAERRVLVAVSCFAAIKAEDEVEIAVD